MTIKRLRVLQNSCSLMAWQKILQKIYFVGPCLVKKYTYNPRNNTLRSITLLAPVWSRSILLAYRMCKMHKNALACPSKAPVQRSRAMLTDTPGLTVLQLSLREEYCLAWGKILPVDGLHSPKLDSLTWMADQTQPLNPWGKICLQKVSCSLKLDFLKQVAD